MSDVDLAALRSAAEDLNSEPWYCTTSDEERYDGYEVWTHDGESHWVVATAPLAPTAAFIAAANPTAILTLVERLEAAEAAVARVRALIEAEDTRAATSLSRTYDGTPFSVGVSTDRLRAALGGDR